MTLKQAAEKLKKGCGKNIETYTNNEKNFHNVECGLKYYSRVSSKRKENYILCGDCRTKLEGAKIILSEVEKIVFPWRYSGNDSAYILSRVEEAKKILEYKK